MPALDATMPHNRNNLTASLGTRDANSGSIPRGRSLSGGHGRVGFAEAGAVTLSGHPVQASAAPRRLKVLVIDDEPSMRVLLRGCFEHAGFSVVEAANADELWVAMAQNQFDLMTLDVRLPGAGGLELVQAIRQRSNVPIIMISVITNMIDRVTALERGADDFIVKPFDLMDLMARVRAVVRRSDARSAVVPSPTAHRRYAFDGWLFDAGRRELTSIKGDVKSLTDQELSLLELFVQHPQRELSRETIINHLHGTSGSEPVLDGPALDAATSDGEAQSSRLRVDMQVSRLRKKLELPDSGVSVIKSVRGVGYVFATSVVATVG
jgi:two-component system, OmpR family, response regulator